MNISFEFMEVVRLRALVEREIQIQKNLLDVCRGKRYRDLDEDSLEENIKTIELLEKEIPALEVILEKLSTLSTRG